MEYDILRSDHAVPVRNNRFIHVRHILERPVAEHDDIGVVEWVSDIKNTLLPSNL